LDAAARNGTIPKTKQTMTPEQLLIQRYKVIAPYPGSEFEIGDILNRYYFETSTSGMYTYLTNIINPLEGKSMKKEYVEGMPNIFQPLPWYAEREPGDMPPFIKRRRSDGTIEVLRVLDPSCDRREFGHEDGTIEHRFVYKDGAGGEPATLAEYEKWKQSKNK
jgi:hypothetical protein